MTQPTQDLVVAFAVAYNAAFKPFCRHVSPCSWATTAYPLNDDPRFPYKPRYGHATGFQFDLLGLRYLPTDYADGLLDDLGHPILDDYGAPIA